jgi:hypothetical protein
LLGLVADERAEARSGKECGDEARATQRDGDAVREAGAGNRDDLKPRTADQVSAIRERDDAGGG